MKVFLTGVTGFVGQHMLQRLLSQGHSVRGLVRPGTRGALFSSSTHPDWRENFSYSPGDVVNGTGLDRGVEGCEAVIHLVGIIVEKGKNTFAAVHHVGTRNVVDAAKRAGIKRFVHMSALGVGAGVAAYQTSKWKGEQEVRNSGIPYCILRPSLIFGPGDGFVTQMMDIMRKGPLLRLVPGDGQSKYRPVFIGDVTACFASALNAGEATNQTIELGGADELSLNEVLEEIARCAGVRKRALHIPMPLMFLGAALAQSLLPNPPVTVDQLRMLREGSTCDLGAMKRIFKIEPRGFAGCGR
ncbi:MAG TPA: complex I NDUFA9 subunit family protein [Terriglobales bacterium]